jgi:hypothetical protein
MKKKMGVGGRKRGGGGGGSFTAKGARTTANGRPLVACQPRRGP